MDAAAKKSIDEMSREDLARRWRLAPPEDTFWQGEAGVYAYARFLELGGWSPDLSKRIGW